MKKMKNTATCILPLPLFCDRHPTQQRLATAERTFSTV